MTLLKVFLDTNVLLDCSLKRELWYKCANEILFSSQEEKTMKAYVAATSLKDVYYITEKQRDEEYARKAVNTIMSVCNIASVTPLVCKLALSCSEPDFEDGIIAASARTCGADIILSRDKNAFNDCGILKIHPQHFYDFFLKEKSGPETEEEWAVCLI